MSYLCVCGHVIKDNVYPCPETGDLKWQTESDRVSQDMLVAFKGFIDAVENGKKDEWLSDFFSPGYRRVDVARAIYDIFEEYEHSEGHSVYRCLECERIYIQKEYRSDEYSCYEKREGYSRN